MLKRLFTLGTLLCWAALAPASYELDRAAQALDRGQSAKARFLYGRILDIDPCDRAAQAGLIRAQGDVSPYRNQCPPEPSASPFPGAPAQSSPATPEVPATPAAVSVVATVPPSPVAPPDGGQTAQPKGANDLGVQPQRHRRQGGDSSRRGWAWAEWGGFGILAVGLALAGVLEARRRRALALSAPATADNAAPEATPAPQDDVPRPAEIPPAAPATLVQVAATPQPLGPRALPPELSPAVPAAWASPLAPGEAVIARLDGAQGQAGFTAHQFYFQGPRGVKEGWFRRQETLTLAVPLHQVTGLGWAQRGGERLIVGTALAGDIVLSASDFGALALRQFAQQLAAALERPLT